MAIELEERAAVSVPELVAGLPEIYQPIYGHPEFSSQVARHCDDRLAVIEQAWRVLGQALGRPPRVLDMGCAQGYVSLRLAELGAEVIGIDHFQENIAVCQALAAEHPELRVSFLAANLERLFDYLDMSKVDLVLGLSVVHHMAAAHGHEAITQWIGGLGKQVAACIFELALAQEPVHWAPALPADERDLLSGFAFVHELSRIPTHLSTIMRPMYFASNFLWQLDNQVDLFRSMTRSSHTHSGETCGGSRRYFFQGERLAKVYSLRDKFPRLNAAEILNEVAFLSKPPPGFMPLPQLHAWGVREDREAWLVRDSLPGELLYDCILADKPYNVTSIIRDVLKQLVVLEERGLYHNDIKPWNVLLLPDGTATLIDYGSISPHKEAFSWPQQLFSSFWLFVWCIATKSQWSGQTFAPPFASPYNLPEPYLGWARIFWALPVPSWSFQLLLSTFDVAMAGLVSNEALNAQEVWRRNVECYLAELSQAVSTLYATSATA